MNKQNELIINHDKKAIICSFFIVQPIIGLTAGLFFLLANATQNDTRAIVLNIVAQCSAWFFTLLLSWSVLYSIYYFFSNTPLAIIDDEGIWVKHYGFTPWSEIITIQSYFSLATQAFIKVKDPANLYKQCDWYGRFMLLLMSCMNLKRNISLTSIDIPKDEFLQFIKPYLKEELTETVFNQPSELIVKYLTTYQSRLIVLPMPTLLLLRFNRSSAVSNTFIYTFATIILLRMLIKFIRSKKRLAYLDKNGIIINHFGFIPWQDIEIMEFYGSHLSKETFSIGIYVNDLTALKKQADWIGKLKIALNQLLSRWFKKPRYHITILNQDSLSATGEIMDFAKRYLPQ